MKKILSAVLALAVLLALTACGSPAPAEPTVPVGPVLGVTEGSTYTNDFFGMTCTFRDGWLVADEEQLAQIMGVTTDALTQANLDTTGSAYSLYASAADGLSSVNIVMENLGTVYGMILDTKTYAENSVKQLPAALEAVGMSNVTAQVTTATFAGREETAVTIQATMSGVNFYETMICLKQGSYIAVVTAASYYEDTTADILAVFEPV